MTRSLRLPLLLLFLLSLTAGCGIATGIIEDALDDAGGGSGGSGNTAEMTAEERAYALEVLDLVNQHRANNSLPALAWDEAAAQAAFDHSVFQQAQGNISHEGAGGSDAGDRLFDAGIFWSTWRENVAVGQPTPSDVVQSWIDSPGHNANMLASDVTHLGVGCRFGAGGAYGGPWWTQKFFSL